MREKKTGSPPYLTRDEINRRRSMVNTVLLHPSFTCRLLQPFP